MIRMYAVVAASLFVVRERTFAHRRNERGLGTLEMVVLGLGLLLFATAVVAVFKAAIDSRTEKIK